jgi:ribosomal protein L7/L12
MQQKTELQLTTDVERLEAKVAKLEALLYTVCDTVGIPYQRPGTGLTQDVVDLARTGDRLGAIKRYREVTGASLDEARAALADI